ncbi:MAG TPA: hypothetical protein VFA57_09350 [Pseudolabrys sp.]|nr:hypothetical protein [Pseudolabrys sp.]
MTTQRRKCGWLMLAVYVCLAFAVPALTPPVDYGTAFPPIAPLTLADLNPDEAMMSPLRMQANAALQALQTAQQTASAN